MSIEWDVATFITSDGRRVVYTRDQKGLWNGFDNYGEAYTGRDMDSRRRLVVIDPEDAEQVERLAKLLWPHYAAHEHARLCKSEITADALREFASPAPRIEEPQGLGAVVEDAEGHRFVRHCDCSIDAAPDWRCSQAVSSAPSVRWADIKAVRVLSVGVTP